MSICKPGFKQRILAFLLVLALLFVICEDVHRASALALTATTGALAVGAFLLISAGVVFATTGDLRKGTDAFLKAYPETLQWCEDRAKSIVGGVVTLLPDMAADMMTLASKAAEFFQSTSVKFEDIDSSLFTDVNGQSVVFWDVPVSGGVMSSSLHLYDELTVWLNASTTIRYYVTQDSGKSYLNYEYSSGSKGVIRNKSGSFPYFFIAKITANVNYVKTPFYWPYFFEAGSSFQKNWASDSIPGSIRCDTFSSTGSLVEDIPFGWAPTYPGADVYNGYQKELSGTGTSTGALTMDLVNTGVMDDVSKPELTLPLTATQAGVVASTGTTPTPGDVPPPDPGGGSVNVDGLKLPDLRDVFPFCVPFDLINLVSALDAEPKAPVFKVPVDFGFAGYSEEVSIDFSRFDKVAAALRWGETLLFIAGLILITRKIIQG